MVRYRDLATIDGENYIQLTDRAKDVIKSGGEWISSIDVENLAMGCPGVAEAAVIGIPHPQWEERPLLVIVALPMRQRQDRSSPFSRARSPNGGSRTISPSS